MTAMTFSTAQHPNSPQPMPRERLIFLIKTALSIGENRYARQVALTWLANFPGDLEVSLLNAQSLIQSGLNRQALSILEALCEKDPEFLEAQKLIAQTHSRLGQQDDIAKDCVVALGGRPLAKSLLPKWAVALREARLILDGPNRVSKLQTPHQLPQTELDKAEKLVHQALLDNPPTPLAAIAHLKLNLKRDDLPTEAVQDLALAYHNRWPNCLIFTLVLADAWMDSGRTDQAVALLHTAVCEDVCGQVARRLWGENHPYRSLWPEDLCIDLDAIQKPQDLPVPAAVAAVLGLNLLTSSEDEAPPNLQQEPPRDSEPPVSISTKLPTEPEFPENHPAEVNRKTPLPKYQIPETLVSVQRELEQIAEKIKKPYLGKADGRFPIYVIFTTRAGLEKQYGIPGAERIDLEMRRLAEAVSQRRNWRAILYYADRPDLSPDCSAYPIQPVAPADPWELKLALADLDALLARRGEMIGAVLIVGGPEVVPFHHLPNPVDDSDFDVPSDNPYSTRDENYFIPEWPVGRLPDGAGEKGQTLLNALAKAIHYHKSQAKPTSHQKLSWEKLIHFLSTILPWHTQELPSLGYSAAIWQRASLSVFRTIGDPRYLLISPPVQVQTNGKASFLQLPSAQLAYFNLHGLPDSAEWYGQRDPFDLRSECDFPVALRPEDIRTANGSPNGKIHRVVFSEACYGAHIQSKDSSQAICLKFLQAGCQAFIGSTVTSYGSISTPLIAADLLGRAFWQFLAEGTAVGEALRRAKIVLAKEMHRRQGFLDGEDQKTLISFILYGDPLFQTAAASRGSKQVLRALASPAQVKTVCDRQTEDANAEAIPPEILDQVKKVVAEYLPGMKGAQVSVHTERAGCGGKNHTCPTAQLGGKSLPEHPPHRKVVVLSKQIQQSSKVHRQFARLTLDERGKLVKLVVSR